MESGDIGPVASETPNAALEILPPDSIVRSRAATWWIVLMLAWPVLGQQFLVLAVQLSDRYLAGNFEAVTEAEQIAALRHRLFATAHIGGAVTAGNGLGGVVAAQTSLRESDRIMSKQASYLAAQTNASYFSWFLSSYTILITVGSTALVARSVGARDIPSALRFTNQSLLLAFVFGLAGSILGVLFIDKLIWLLQLRGESAEYAVAYLFPMFALFVFQVIELAGIACLVGAGDTRTGLWVIGGVALVNIPVSWGLCLGWGPLPRLGFVGISWGTALAHLLGGLVVMIVLLRGRYGLHVQWQFLRPDLDKIRRLLRISVPAGVDSISIVVCQFWFLSIVNQLGDVAGSAHGIAINWEALGFLSGMAFGTAAMTLVGQNLGAQQPAQAARSGWTAFVIGCLVMTAMGAVFFTFARPMFVFFCPHPWQAPIVEAGIPLLRLVAFAMPFLASAIIFTHALRGAGDTTVPVIFTWVGFLLVRIPLAYWLALPEVHLGPLGTLAGWNMGLFGAWLAMFADLLLRGVLLGWRFASGAWKSIRV